MIDPPLSCRGGLHGERLAHHFGIRATSTLTVKRHAAHAIVMTRLCGTVPAGMTSARLRPEPAFSIVVQLQGLEYHRLDLGRRSIHTGPVPIGAVSVLSIEDLPRSTMTGNFDALQLYVPHAAFQDFADENHLGRVTGLTWPRAEPDPVAASLGSLLVGGIEAPDGAKSMFIEHLLCAFLAHAARQYGGAPNVKVGVAGGLAPWQERRAKEMMRARLATCLSMSDVARECRLSPSYFAAAFRRSTGRQPHRYLSELRIEEAKSLMLTMGLPLADIALLCGFSDQSYFTRVFKHLVGTSPGHWRRAHRAIPISPDAM